MEQVQRSKQKARTQESHTDETSVDATNTELAEKTDQVVSDIDGVLEDQLDAELLADIDDVLGTEEEAAQMVRDFVQHGGQ